VLSRGTTVCLRAYRPRKRARGHDNISVRNCQPCAGGRIAKQTGAPDSRGGGRNMIARCWQLQITAKIGDPPGGYGGGYKAVHTKWIASVRSNSCTLPIWRIVQRGPLQPRSQDGLAASIALTRHDLRLRRRGWSVVILRWNTLRENLEFRSGIRITAGPLAGPCTSGVRFQ